jgi:hypothetical protein
VPSASEGSENVVDHPGRPEQALEHREQVLPEAFGPCFAVRLSSSAASSSRPAGMPRGLWEDHPSMPGEVSWARDVGPIDHRRAQRVPYAITRFGCYRITGMVKRQVLQLRAPWLQGERAGTGDLVSHCEMLPGVVTSTGGGRFLSCSQPFCLSTLRLYAPGFPDLCAQLWGRCPPPLTRGVHKRFFSCQWRRWYRWCDRPIITSAMTRVRMGMAASRGDH